MSCAKRGINVVIIPGANDVSGSYPKGSFKGPIKLARHDNEVRK
jgi:hypothetical protein